MASPRLVLLVATFDSQLKWCAGLRDAFADAGFGCRVMVPAVRSALSAGQIHDAGFDTVERVSWGGLLDAAAAADVVVSALSGPLTSRLSVGLATRSPAPDPGPVLVSGWVGVIIEKIVAGYLDRCGTDVVAVNCRQDLAIFTAAAARLGLPTGNLLLTGLPLLSGAVPVPRAGPIRRVLFADQPTVPDRLGDRVYLYQRLIDYARSHPDREVIFKPRHRPGEDTFHQMERHPVDVIAGWDLPTNFMIDYTPITAALADVDLLLTISSTACLEAVDRGCRVALVLDLGVHERHGNHVFLDSGLLRTFDQIGRDEVGTPDPEWLAGYFFKRDQDAPEAIVTRVEDLLANHERPRRVVWDSAYFTSVIEYQTQVGHRSDALRRRIARHGRVLGVGIHLTRQSMSRLRRLSSGPASTRP